MVYNCNNSPNCYSSVISRFVMKDKPTNAFNPKNKDFKDLLEYALRKSFADFNFRTLNKVKDKNGKAKIDNELQKDETVTAYLIEKLDEKQFLSLFVTYFWNKALDKDDFDKWHHEACDKFLKIIRDLDIYSEIEHGKAQKIVNMMFKHLYCLNGADKYSDYFKYCHFVLDSFTLEWFRRDVVKEWYNESNEESISTSSEDKPFPKWSNITYRDPSNLDYNKAPDRIDNGGYYHYMFFQTMIRNYFDAKHAQCGCTPFQAEFHIWPDIQIHLACEDFYFALCDNLSKKDKEDFKKKDLNDKKAEIKNQL